MTVAEVEEYACRLAAKAQQTPWLYLKEATRMEYREQARKFLAEARKMMDKEKKDHD